MRLRLFSAEHGYALPMVLLAIAVFLLFVGQTSSRVIREARVTKVKENAEFAFYAADAGFNRARARFIKKATDAEMMALDGRSDTLTYVDDNGVTQQAGQYTLQITSVTPGEEYYVVSTGSFGPTGSFHTKRVVAGTIKKSGTISGGARSGDRRVTTTYTP